MKKRLLSLLLAVLSFSAYGIYDVGDEVPNLCWKDAEAKKLCLDDNPNHVRVLLFGAGWCKGCSREMQELVPKLKRLTGRPVVFYSLLTEGWKHSSPADASFLIAWKEKYQLPFFVAASPHDGGRQFFIPPVFIPNVVIIAKDRTVFSKETGGDAESLLESVGQALQDHHPIE